MKQRRGEGRGEERRAKTNLGVEALCQGRGILLRQEVGLLQRTDLEELLV